MDDTLPTGIVRVDLADEENPLPLLGQSLSHQFLGCSLAIHLSCVDEGQSELHPKAQGLDLLCPAASPLGHLPSALPERRNAFTVRQGDSQVHRQLSWGNRQ